MPDLHRRHLPHWSVDDRIPYFVTWRLRTGTPPLEDSERDIVAGAIRFFDNQRYDLLAWVVMNDHVHVLFVLNEPHTVAKTLHSWKSFTAHEFLRLGYRTGRIWQEESFDRIVRSDAELLDKMAYIQNNPCRRWPECVDYRWVWSKWSTGGTPVLRTDRRDACPTI